MNKEGGGLIVMLKRGLVSALGVLAGSYLIEGIGYDDNTTLFMVVVLLGVFSAVLKPILVLFALPFVLVTLGIGVLFINALLYLLVGNLVDGFQVDSFGSAFFGALIITMFNLLFSGWIGERRGGGLKARMSGSRGSPRSSSNGNQRKQGPRAVKPKDDVIDI